MNTKPRKYNAQIMVTCTKEQKTYIQQVAAGMDRELSDLGRELLLKWANKHREEATARTKAILMGIEPAPATTDDEPTEDAPQVETPIEETASEPITEYEPAPMPKAEKPKPAPKRGRPKKATTPEPEPKKDEPKPYVSPVSPEKLTEVKGWIIEKLYGSVNYRRSVTDLVARGMEEYGYTFIEVGDAIDLNPSIFGCDGNAVWLLHPDDE